MSSETKVPDIKPGHPIWDEVWRRSRPDAEDHASHLQQLFEALAENATLRDQLAAVPMPVTDEEWISVVRVMIVDYNEDHDDPKLYLRQLRKTVLQETSGDAADAQ